MVKGQVTSVCELGQLSLRRANHGDRVTVLSLCRAVTEQGADMLQGAPEGRAKNQRVKIQADFSAVGGKYFQLNCDFLQFNLQRHSLVEPLEEQY